MEFSWSEEESAAYDETVKFAGSIRPHAAHGALDREVWRRLGEFGLLGLSLPGAVGGSDCLALATVHLMEAFGQGSSDAGIVFSAAAHLFACAMPISEHASERVRQSILPKLASGAWVGANAITEADAGSDVFGLRALARCDGDRYFITGEKTYVTNGPVADVFVVYATTNPKYGHLGVTGFVVEATSAGIRRGKPFHKVGLQGSPMSSVYFDEVEVSADAVLARPGQGAMVFASSMQWERACLFGMYVGIMQRELQRCVAHAKERRQGGKPIGEYQAVSHRLVEMKARLEAARLLLYRACWVSDQGSDATLDVSLAKLCVSEAAVQNGLDAVRIFGGAGVIDEMGVDRSLRDALPALIFSGTSEIQRNLVAQRMGV